MEFLIDYTSGIPIYRQIIEQVRYSVARGELVTGDRLPTVRQLAVDLSINPNTVARSYRELESEGVLDTQQGSGTFVGRRVPAIDPIERQRRLDQILTELLTRAAAYGLTLEELQAGLRIRQEASS
jgi:GntR family transcriptional regulator